MADLPPDSGAPPSPDVDFLKNLRFGELNDVRKPVFQDKRGGWDFFNSLESIVREFHKPDTFTDTGPYKGVVLRVEPVTQSGVSPATPASQAGTDWTDFLPEQAGRRHRIRVRVPEVHAMLPVPETWGVNASEKDNKIIDLYDVFPAQYLDMTPEPKPGDIVWVDWLQKAGPQWTEPVYLAPINATFPGPSAGAGGAGNALNGACGQQYKNNPPAGDSLAGKNVLLEPYQGLPRVKLSDYKSDPNKDKNPKDKSDWKYIPNNNSDTTEEGFTKFAKVFTSGLKSRIKLQFTTLQGNSGHKGDPLHTPSQRRGLMIAPFYFTATETHPWELIYWLHGADGFSPETFQKNIIPQLNTMMGQQRNFLLVIPELPWSKSGTGTKGMVSEGELKGVDRLTSAFQKMHASVELPPEIKKVDDSWGGDFALFHSSTLHMIKKMIGVDAAKMKTPMISLFGHGAGGSAIARAATEGSMKEVQPDRIFFAEGDYRWGYDGGTAIGAVWKHYVSETSKKVWMTAMTVKPSEKNKGDEQKNVPWWQAKKFFKNGPADLTSAIKDKKHFVYWVEVTGKDYDWCGVNALSTVSPEHRKHLEDLAKKALEAVTFTPTTDDPDEAAEEEENKTEQEEVENKKAEEAGQTPSEDTTEAPKAKNEGTPRPDQKPPASASVNPKQSTTQEAPDPPDWTTVPSVLWKENRVRVKDYGGEAAIIKDKNSNLLTPVGGGVKLHVLAAKRFLAMKKAAAAEGINLIPVSGWRRHKWKSYAEYEAHIAKKYPNGDGKKWLGFMGAHNMGLAIDIKDDVPNGLRVKKATEVTGQNKNSAAGKWLIANAHKYGFTPYKRETWHWECKLPTHAYTTGQEFTDNFATRVTKIGKKRYPNNTAPVSTSSTGGAPCVFVGPDGSAVIAPMNEPLSFEDAPPVSGLGDLLHRGPPGAKVKDPARWKDKYWKKITAFCVHQTAGWPSNIHQRKQKQPTATCSIHFWHCTDGHVMQTCHVAQLNWHCQGGSRHSCGTELTTMGPTQKKFRKSVPRYVQQGHHFITNKKGKRWGDIYADVPKVANAAAVIMLDTPAQLSSLWKCIYGLHKNPPDNSKAIWRSGGKSGKTPINVPIAFPAVDKSTGKFHFSRWAGMPVGSGYPQQAVGDWWQKHQPGGIFCHWNCGHHGDGMLGVYYILCRAMKMSHADAYYTMVGAACSTKMTQVEGGKVPYAPLPNATLTALGKKKYPFPLKASNYVSSHPEARQWHWPKGREKKQYKVHKSRLTWEALVEKNPNWIGDVDNPT